MGKLKKKSIFLEKKCFTRKKLIFHQMADLGGAFHTENRVIFAFSSKLPKTRFPSFFANFEEKFRASIDFLSRFKEQYVMGIIPFFAGNFGALG